MRRHGKKETGTLDTYDGDHRWLYPFSKTVNNPINVRPEVIETPDDDWQSGVADFA